MESLIFAEILDYQKSKNSMPKMMGNGRGMIKVNGYDEFNPDINLARASTLKKKKDKKNSSCCKSK